MKKILFALIAVVVAFNLSGCSSSKVTICELEVDMQDLYEVEGSFTSKIEITSKGDYVVRVVNKEIMTTKNSEIFEAYEGFYMNFKETLGDLEHYGVNVKVEGDTLVYDVDINYEEIDIDDMEAVVGSMSGFLNEDDKFVLLNFLLTYKNMGYSCK